jgi:uncharacterized protein (TIGR02646 family)
MRVIAKQGTGGFHLSQSHTNPPQNHDQATSRWSSFGHKDNVMANLLREQYHLCCYSEFRPDQEGLGHHIEHVENKSQNPARTFDYANLAASALDSKTDLKQLKKQDKTEPEAVFGGHASGKRGRVDLAQFVSCHQLDCARFFAYLPTDGRVVPRDGLQASDNARAQYTIQLLNLNSPFLLTRRRQWGQELQSLLDEHLQKGWSLPHLAQIDLLPANGKLNRFFSLTRQFYGPLAEQALNQLAPELV